MQCKQLFCCAFYVKPTILLYLFHPIPALLRTPFCGRHLLLLGGPGHVIVIVLLFAVGRGRSLGGPVDLAFPCSVLYLRLLFFSVG